MIYVWILIIAIIIYHILAQNPEDSLKNRIRNEEGYPKIDLINVRCDNIPWGVEVLLSCDKEKLSVTANGVEKIIPYENILDVKIEDIEDMSSIPEFSDGKAFAGVVLFGPTGAIAGLTGKKKKLRRLIISYKEDENTEAKNMVFLQKANKAIGVEAVILKAFKNDISAVINGKYTVKKN